MTVKRFKLVEYLPNVIKIEDNHRKLNSHEIVDLLNELHEENERLEDYNNKLMKQPLLFDVQTIPNTMEIMEANSRLEEENEELKEEIKEVKDLIHRMLMQIDVRNIGSNDINYSAIIVFSRNEYNLIKEIWKRS